MEINKCPKCGKEPVLYADIGCFGWRLKCPDCELETDCGETSDEAREKWNELTKNLVTKK